MNTMGFDQYGTTYHDLGEHPRAELLRRLNSKHADKMYVDTADGARHVGYVIAGHWINLHTVTPWRTA